MNEEQVKKNFEGRPPREEDALTLVELRDGFTELALLINRSFPDSREKSLAMTKLEESLLWSETAVARS